jgi:hypothetical protein
MTEMKTLRVCGSASHQPEGVHLIMLKETAPQARNDTEAEFVLTLDEAIDLGWRLINMAGFVRGYRYEESGNTKPDSI